MKRYLGVDLHRTQFTVCTRLENGRTYLRQWPMRELKVFAAQLRKEDELAVEATVGPDGPLVSGRIDALYGDARGGHEVIEYKLTDESNDELDRAQVALYRDLLRSSEQVDARAAGAALPFVSGRDPRASAWPPSAPPAISRPSSAVGTSGSRKPGILPS